MPAAIACEGERSPGLKSGEYHQANDRLAALDLPANVSAKACCEIAVAGDAIPF
jgi:hypothetical protein